MQFMCNLKKTIALFMVFIMVVASATYLAAEEQSREINLIPVRELFESLGSEVSWDRSNGSIHISGGILNAEIILFTHESMSSANGTPVVLHDGIVFEDGRAFMSLNDLIRIEIVIGGFTGGVRDFYLTPEARDIALYDFDYLVNFVIENSPWDTVIPASLGFDFLEMAGLYREFIENMTPLYDMVYVQELWPIRDEVDARSIAANYLVTLLAQDFQHLFQGIGHLVVRDVDMYRMLYTAAAQTIHDEFVDPFSASFQQARYDVFTSPNVVWFYGEYELSFDETPFQQIPGNVISAVLVEDSVGYLRINSFMNDLEFDDREILPFLQEVADFEHLIIDIRSNGGGLVSYFPSLITSRLINEPTEFSSWEFFRAGETTATIFDLIAYHMLLDADEQDEDFDETWTFGIFPAAEFAESRGMTAFDPVILAGLDYVMYSSSIRMPSEDSVGFEGQVWLLIDEFAASASVNAALEAIQMGAILVGNNTSGVTGTMHVYIGLPNTGIIWRTDIAMFTDSLGNSIEVFGVIPHHYNFPDMDALETTLALIGVEFGVEEIVIPESDSLIFGEWKCSDEDDAHIWLCHLRFLENNRFIDGDGDFGSFFAYDGVIIFVFDDFYGEFIFMYEIDGDELLIFDDEGYGILLYRQ